MASAAANSTAVLTMDRVLAKDESQQIDLLDAINDEFGGVIVDINEPMDSFIFGSMLKASIAQWRKQGKRGVWIKLPIEQVNLVEVAVKEGFRYHHAEPTYLMLIFWIPECPNALPANASHRVRIGAFVMNEKSEILVVQEKYGQFRGTGIWKFPTGVADEAEDICVAAVREVKEETDIDAEFLEILAFRQCHNSFFQKSDLFFVCMLRPLSLDIKKQDSEIEAAQWMPWDEFVAQPFVQRNEHLKQICDICVAKKAQKYFGFSGKLVSSGFSDRKSYVYFNTQDLKMK